VVTSLPLTLVNWQTHSLHDTIICSRTYEGHETHVERVLSALAKEDRVLNLDKFNDACKSQLISFKLFSLTFYII
jgi:hypothetical protein